MGWTTMNHKEILIVKFRVYENWIVSSWTNSQLPYRDKYFNQSYSNHLNDNKKIQCTISRLQYTVTESADFGFIPLF